MDFKMTSHTRGEFRAWPTDIYTLTNLILSFGLGIVYFEVTYQHYLVYLL